MPVRLALALVALFAVISLLGLAASYFVTRSTFERTIRESLAQDVAGFRAAPGPFALARLVDAEARETDPERLVLSYLSPTLRHHGNAFITRDSEGYQIVTLDGTQAPTSGRYLALTVQLFGGQLTIARSLDEVERLRGAFLNILALSLVPMLLMALAGGLWLARRSRAQVSRIEATLGRLTSGDLAARVPVGAGWSDDMARIGTRVNEMARAQAQSTAALRQVSTDIAHDLKTPIQRAQLHLDALGAQPLDGEAAETLDRARRELAGIASVFQALLQLARLEGGGAHEDFAPVDLAALVGVFAELYEPSAESSGHLLAVETEAADAMGDRTLLGQALANLIENAMRHTPPGTRITLRSGQEDGVAWLEVADTGPGIPEDERGNVLKRLYRLDRSRNTPGSGLGLSLVAGIARLHRADLTLADAEPGLRVRLSFPAA